MRLNELTNFISDIYVTAILNICKSITVYCQITRFIICRITYSLPVSLIYLRQDSLLYQTEAYSSTAYSFKQWSCL